MEPAEVKETVPPDRAALPLSCQPPRLGPFTAPDPARETVCTPWPSLALMAHWSLVGPSWVGVKVTDSVSEPPAGMVVPTVREVEAAKGPRAGGSDSVMVKVLPPTLLSWKDWVAL